MTAQKLYGLLRFLDQLDERLHLQTDLEAIKDALTNVVSQPANPQYQNELGTALADFQQGASQLLSAISPSQLKDVDSMGGGLFFDSSIAQQVKTEVQMNAMTPAVALNFVQKLTADRAKFLSTVREGWVSLQSLGINTSEPEPGSADLSFLIPREIFDNELGQFAKELTFISRLLQHYSEALTGAAEPVHLEQLSSSVPTIALAAALPVITAVAVIVEKFLAAWERIEKIRKIKADVTAIGFKGVALEQLDEQIETTVDEVVEETTTEVMLNYKGDRKNELTNAIRQDTRRLFGQIERGLTVEFRANPIEGDADVEQRKAFEQILGAAATLRFPQVVPEPMLLDSGEIVEGEIHAVTKHKKTSTHKTTTTKKEPSKEDTAPRKE